MAPQKSVSELASLIKDQAVALENATKNSGGVGLPFTYGSPLKTSLSPSLETARSDLLELVDDLHARLLGPIGYLINRSLEQTSIIAILHFLYSFDVASHVPLDANESITYEDLAARIGVPLDDTRRVVQAAIASRIFEEAAVDTSVKHNAVSSALVIEGMKSYIGLGTEDFPYGLIKFVESLRRYPGSGEPGHAALMIGCRAEAGQPEDVKDPSKSFFDYISSDEKRVKRFRSAMGFSLSSPAQASSHFVENLPWAKTGECPETIVDIAGAGGELCQAILRRYDGVKKAVVLDLPEVVANAKAPGDLEGRLEFAEYNFFTEKVTHRADAYVLRHIFHDWSDQYVVKILRNLVPALQNGSRIWINDIVIEDLSEEKHLQNQRQRALDMMMKQGFNSKERTRRGWVEVFKAADKRFNVETIVQPEGALDAIIGVVFRE
ncbi:S-adenosyl-L-methionine-dependent methyltransferase [Whalleya microplaca]|nr:S-adenosyl-L-methionine-dependent methyltransferase [Whalleya microplaca]